MTQKNARNIKLVLSALTLCLVAQQSITSQASASMITGVKPEDMGNGHNRYDITPEGLFGDKNVGFKTYGNFKLDEGDVANLIFNYYGKDISKFVNLVDNQIDINGIVNAVNANGQFNGGNVMFISPKGMVVGASGVLNVGSLTVLTPDQKKYEDFVKDPSIRTDLSDLYSEGTGTVTIDGKVISRGDVDIRAAAVNINNSIMAGVGNNNEVFTTNRQADILFNSLVNTDNLKPGNNFASDNGNIRITAYSGDAGVKLAQGSTLKNFGKGNIEITSKGSEGIIADGDIKNPSGNVVLTTTNGSIEVRGNVINRNGNITADSANGIYLAQNAQFNNENGNVTLTNKGTKGIDIKGTITNKDGDLSMTNSGTEGITIDGVVTNENGNSTYTNESGALIVNGNVNNSEGLMKFDNTGSGIQVNSDAHIINTNGDFEMSNTGIDGINISGNIDDIKGSIDITNTNGDLNINNGALINHEAFREDHLNITNSGNKLYIDGDVVSENGTMNISNTGDGGIHLDKNGNIINNMVTDDAGQAPYVANDPGLFISNDGAGSIDIDGNIQVGSDWGSFYQITNSGKGGININETGVINGKNLVDNSSIINTGDGGIKIAGKIITDINGENFVSDQEKGIGLTIQNDNKVSGIHLTGTGVIDAVDSMHTNIINNGEKGIVIDGTIDQKRTNELDNPEIYINNTGAGGMHLNGTISNANGSSYFINEAGDLNVNGTVSNNNDSMEFRNTGNSLNVGETGIINSEGKLVMDNTGAGGMNISGTVNSLGDADITNSNGSLNIYNGAIVSHKSVNNNHLNITNSGQQLYIDGDVISENGAMNISNTGTEGLHIDKNANITNKVISDDESIPVFEKHNPQLNITNDSIASMDIDGTVNVEGSYYNITNSGGGALNINQTANINGNISKESYITNKGDGGLNIAGNINTNNSSSEGRILDAGLTIQNDNANSGIHITSTGHVNSENSNHTYISNNGEKGILVDGKITQNSVGETANSLKITNTGNDGINITSTGRVNNNSSTYIENSGKEGIKVAGLINTNGLNVKNTNSNVVIGDETENDNYITSSDDVNINIENGSLLNSGVDKTLIKTTNDGNLNINVIDGSVGLDDGNKGMYIGVGPDSRDFTKSINVNVDGAITATTEQNQTTEDLNVNIAGKNSDLKIDHIKADGKVILTAADFDENNKGYSILNASTDPTKANVEGKGIALIASDKIGDGENKLTFNQTAGQFNTAGYDLDKLEYTPNADYGMDVLAINDINIKGLDDKYDTNVGTMISREGSINAEFSGNTYIREVTADKGLNLVTRGAEFVIDNLGTVPNTPEDYFGPNGDIAPDTVIVKALDINPNTRVDDAGLVDGIHSHWADSHIIIKNGRVDDNAKIVFTGDNVYAGGYRFYMGRERNEDGKTYWVYDDRTAMTDMSGNDPTIRVNAVREKDVTEIGRQEEERNYYTGGSVQEDEPWYGDDDDDDDHLIVPEPPGDDDDDDDDGPNPPGDDDDDDDDGPNPPGDDDDDDDHGVTMDDAKRTWKKVIADNVNIVDKRQYMRFNIDGTIPVKMDPTDKIVSIVDISRGGIAVSHNNNLKVGDVVPVHITYGDIDINADVKVVTASDVRAGAEFVNLDSSTANRILYLNLLLEEQQMLSSRENGRQI